MKNNVIIFGNNKDICGKLKAQLHVNGYISTMSVSADKHWNGLPAGAIESVDEKSIILVFRNEELKDITEIFHHQGIKELFVFPWDTHKYDDNAFFNCLIQIDNEKPRLDYLEIEVAEGCNLNCKGCNEFSNLINSYTFSDLDSVKSDLTKLRELFWGIGKIRLMGGEPLINPDFPKFVKIAREIFPDCDLRLLSNGLLIPKLHQKDLEIVKKNNCSFDISVYPPTKKIIRAITRRLDEFEIPYSFSLPNTYFFKSLLSEPLSSSVESFENCLFTHCHALSGGYLSSCSNQMYAYRLNSAFDLTFPESDKIDLFNTPLNGWEINEIFKNPHNFCRFCGRGLVPYKWKTCPAGKAKASDWLIEPTFFNLKVMPVVQKIVKSPAKHLRSKIRIPKNRKT